MLIQEDAIEIAVLLKCVSGLGSPLRRPSGLIVVWGQV